MLKMASQNYENGQSKKVWFVPKRCSTKVKALFCTLVVGTGNELNPERSSVVGSPDFRSESISYILLNENTYTGFKLYTQGVPR